MIRNTIHSIFQTTRTLVTHWHSLAIFAGLYALLLAAMYGFVAIREATAWQVLLTLLFIAAAPVLFFLLQAAIIDRAQTGRIEWYRALRHSCKLALIALPIIAFGIAVFWLSNRWQAHFPVPRVSQPLTQQASPPATRPPMHWPTILFATGRALIFVIVLPLLTIRLWVEVANHDLIAFIRSGVRPVLRRLGQTLARAFATESLVLYSLGLIVFALIPYVLLFVRIPMRGVWSEIAVFSVRLVMVFLFTFLGWVITLSTFAGAPEAPVAEAASEVKKSDE